MHSFQTLPRNIVSNTTQEDRRNFYKKRFFRLIIIPKAPQKVFCWTIIFHIVVSSVKSVSFGVFLFIKVLRCGQLGEVIQSIVGHSSIKLHLTAMDSSSYTGAGQQMF